MKEFVVAQITDRADTATAIGTYTGFQSICTMLASSLTGYTWFQFGPGVAFALSACMALFVAIYLLFIAGEQKYSTIV